MSDWMNIIAKRELTDEERADIQNFVNEPTKEEKIAQMKATQTAQKNRQIPSMIDLPPTQEQINNVPSAPNLPPSTLPLHPKLQQIGFTRKKGPTLLKPKNQGSTLFKPRNQTQQPQQPQPQQPQQAQQAPQPVPLPTQQTNQTPNDMAKTKINNMISQVKNQIQQEQNRSVRGTEEFDKQANIKSLTAKLKQLEDFKAKNNL